MNPRKRLWMKNKARAQNAAAEADTTAAAPVTETSVTVAPMATPIAEVKTETVKKARRPRKTRKTTKTTTKTVATTT
jgi:hypothetical protein